MASNYVAQRLAEINASSEMKERALRHRDGVVREKTRHGKTVYYYRKGAGRRIRLPDPDIQPMAFNQAYLAAVRGKEISFERSPAAPSMDVGKAGYVYFVQSGESVKIGFSQNVGNRLKALRTGTAEGAKIVLVIPGTQGTERYFHAHFAAHRLSGEWFRLDGALAAFIAASPSLACSGGNDG